MDWPVVYLAQSKLHMLYHNNDGENVCVEDFPATSIGCIELGQRIASLCMDDDLIPDTSYFSSHSIYNPLQHNCPDIQYDVFIRQGIGNQ